MRAYNLFRHRDKPHLLCAVPEDGEVPRFMAERAWRFDRKLAEAAAAPLGFDVLAARQGLRAFECEERLYRLLMRAAYASGSVAASPNMVLPGETVSMLVPSAAS